jgi:hypothetical protein
MEGGIEPMSEHLKIVDSHERCRFLLSKGMYVNANIEDDEHLVGDGHFWCGRNQRIYGPDEQLCGDEYCRNPSRSCYETH